MFLHMFACVDRRQECECVSLLPRGLLMLLLPRGLMLLVRQLFAY